MTKKEYDQFKRKAMSAASDHLNNCLKNSRCALIVVVDGDNKELSLVSQLNDESLLALLELLSEKVRGTMNAMPGNSLN